MQSTQLALFSESPSASSCGRTSPASSTPPTTPLDASSRGLPAKMIRSSRQGVDGRTLVECWDHREQSRGGSSTPNTSEWPNDAAVCSLWQVLERGSIPQRYFLSSTACAGILRRAEKRGAGRPGLRWESHQRPGRWLQPGGAQRRNGQRDSHPVRRESRDRCRCRCDPPRCRADAHAQLREAAGQQRHELRADGPANPGNAGAPPHPHRVRAPPGIPGWPHAHSVAREVFGGMPRRPPLQGPRELDGRAGDAVDRGEDREGAGGDRCPPITTSGTCGSTCRP